jgi:hypothetical protein
MIPKEDLDKYIAAGYSKDEIVAKLKADGYNDFDIEQATLEFPTIPQLGQEVAKGNVVNYQEEEAKRPNAKGILMGILFIGLGATRLMGMRGSGDFNSIIGFVLIGFGLFRLVTGLMGK